LYFQPANLDLDNTCLQCIHLFETNHKFHIENTKRQTDKYRKIYNTEKHKKTRTATA